MDLASRFNVSNFIRNDFNGATNKKTGSVDALPI